MKIKILLVLVLGHLFCINVFGQEKSQNNSYSRVSLTVVYIDDPSPDETINQSIRKSIINFFQTNSIVPDKFDNHSISTRIEKIDINNISTSADDVNKIFSNINQSNIPNQIVAKWFNRSTGGMMDMELIKERGRYNASDNDYLTAVAGQRQGKILEDMGEKLLQKSYILFINCSDITPYKNEKNEVLYFSGSARGYLYRLVWDEETSANFYNNLWINDTDDDNIKNKKREDFDKANFKAEYVSFVSVSDNQFTNILAKLSSVGGKLELLYAKLADNILTKLESKVNDFQVKINILSTNPISATIGKKEGLYIDQRFFVMENKINSKQKIIEDRQAVVRVKKIADNRHETKGESVPSVFYQAAGGVIDNFGMYVKQKNDRGLAFSAALLMGGIGGTDWCLSYNISRAFSKNLGIHLFPGLNIYGEFGFDSGNYSDLLYSGSNKYSFSRSSFGLIKEHYFWRNFHASYKLGFGRESTELTGSKVVEEQLRISNKFTIIGVKAGMNIFHNVQLFAGINYYLFRGNSYLTQGEETSVELDSGWSDYFYNRKGISMVTGLKIII